ncbi:MAG TPA: S8/S53 family peptidase [Herpetosiphonaceae bacterium]
MTPKQPSDERQVSHFLPSQLLLLVEHQGTLSGDQLVRLINRSNHALQDAHLSPRRVISFPQTRAHTDFSLVFTDVYGVEDQPAELLPLIKQLEVLFDQPDQQVTLRAVSPNWQSERAPLITGWGPGAEPIPAPKLAERWHKSKIDDLDTPFGFTLPALPVGDGAKTGVEVAIMDTAPCVHDLIHAYNTWQEDHPLIRSLLRPGGQLEITYASLEEHLRLSRYTIKNRDAMGDHGLFVAGIIHTIAPHARLNLIEVLNPFGIGDIESLAVGLQSLLQRPSSQSLIVNCSLVVNIPQPEEREALAAIDPAWNSVAPEQIRRMSWPLEWMFNVLHDRDVLVIAAAGNDADTNHRPAARYPAALDCVIGVGALERDSDLAVYTNIADSPASQGFVTIGGDAANGKALPNTGMLGIYIGTFPNGRRSTTGWAWWAGTSFAAPVICGSLTMLLGHGKPSTQALQILRDAEGATTAQGEEIFSVQQGRTPRHAPSNGVASGDNAEYVDMTKQRG